MTYVSSWDTQKQLARTSLILRTILVAMSSLIRPVLIWLLSMNQLGVLLLPLDEMLVHRAQMQGLAPASECPVYIYSHV